MNKIRPLAKVKTEYTKIKDLTDDMSAYFNSICKVENVYDWSQSKGEDLMLTLKVSDESSPDMIYIKVFRNEPTFLHGFNRGDLIKVKKFKYFKVGFYLLEKDGTIEVMSKNNELPDSKKETVSQLHPIRQIKDLQHPEYIRFTGKLIYKHKESENITILGFIDNTINPHIKKCENKAFYEPNMVLYVKAWDSMAVKALTLNQNSFYCLENLKVKIEISKVAAELSENIFSKITEVTDESLINEILLRSTIPKDKLIKFATEMYNDSKLFRIKEIKEPGHYRIHVKILRHHPKNGQYINVCTLCKVAQEESIFKCECGSKPERFLLVKYLVKDESGEFVLICKDKVAKEMLARATTDLIIELLVYCDYKYGKLYIEVRDVPNFV